MRTDEQYWKDEADWFRAESLGWKMKAVERQEKLERYRSRLNSERTCYIVSLLIIFALQIYFA